MSDGEKYFNETDHDLLIRLNVSADEQTKHLEKINGRLNGQGKDITRLKIVVAVILAAGGAELIAGGEGIAKILSLMGA